MKYSELTDDQEILLERYGMLDGDTINTDFDLSSNQLNVLGLGGGTQAGSTDTSKSLPVNLDRVTPVDDVFAGIDSAQSDQMPMMSDTIDYTAKIGVQTGINESARREREQQEQEKLMDEKAYIESIDINSGNDKKDYKNALQIQGVIDGDGFSEEATNYARNKFYDRFGQQYDRIEAKTDDKGRLTGAKLIPKSVGRQGADFLFSTEAIDEGSILGGALNPFGIGSKVVGKIQNPEQYLGSEQTMYETDELSAMRDADKVSADVLKNVIGKLYQKEQEATDPKIRQTFRKDRMALQRELDNVNSPTFMEGLAEFGSASIDPTIIGDLGLMYRAGKGLYRGAKAGTLLDDTKNIIRGARTGADELFDDVGVLDDVAEDSNQLLAPSDNVEPLAIGDYSADQYAPIEPDQILPMPTEKGYEGMSLGDIENLSPQVRDSRRDMLPEEVAPEVGGEGVNRSRPSSQGEVIDVESEVVDENPLAPVGKSISDVGKKLSEKSNSFAVALGNLLQGIGVGASELEQKGLIGLADAVKKGGYKAFVELPEQQKDLLKALILEKGKYDEVVKELGAREGQLPKEFADEILEGFVRGDSNTNPRSQAKRDRMWEGTGARRLEEAVLGDYASKEASNSVRNWLENFYEPKMIDGSTRPIPEEQKLMYRNLAQNELEQAIGKEAFGKMLAYANKGDMTYPEVLELIRTIDDNIDFDAPKSAIRGMLELRSEMNRMIRNATEKQIQSGKFDNFFGEGVDTASEYDRLRKSLAESAELNDNFRQYARLKGEDRGLSDFDIDQLADKVATAFGKITSKKGQTISQLENNTAYKLLQRIDEKQGTDFAEKVRIIQELYTNPQVEVTKIKGGNKLGGYRLPPRADKKQWAQAEYFGMKNIPDRARRAWNRLESAVFDWSQPRFDLGATQQNKVMVDAVSSLINAGLAPAKLERWIIDQGIPARDVRSLMSKAHAGYKDKGSKRTKSKSKDVETKDDQEVRFKSLAEVGRR